ncbi:hypothetical protein JQN72_01625 [Phycicoccus sp. CSK15P-2]|uniref:hypothetical protein n=1 Tax=Phycicoccus sp. CSK15P-2 TaxID=2807627 RepID=UPI0019529F9B|nr:hypothetical protein [Phycicoccus sp. CSK15P-2]MBM6402946.1 hypothetical protein [Phycicoccus sp. CSK15P-2]
MSPYDRRADRRQRFAARVRRLPGYRFTVEELLPRVRGSRVLTDIVWRVFTPPHGVGVARRSFRADRLQVPEPDLLPVVVFTVLGVDAATLDRALTTLVALHEETRAFRGVVVVDRPDLVAVRQAGFVADHIIPAEDWYGAAEDHTAYVGRRLVSAVQGFRAWYVVHLGADGTVPERDELVIRSIRGAMSAPGSRTPFPEAPA